MRTLPARHLHATKIDKTALTRLCSAPSFVLHYSAQVARQGLWSLGASTALQNCSSAWMAWTLTIVDIPRHVCCVSVLDTVGVHSLSLVRKALATPGAGTAGFEEASGKSFSGRWSAALRSHQDRRLISPFILWALTRTEHGGQFHSALLTSRRASRQERPSLKLASVTVLSKLFSSLSWSGTRRSFERADHCSYVIPSSAARVPQILTFKRS
jgi:hypothetical protein